MARLKRTVDYVNELRFNPNPSLRKLGETLQKQYEQWTRSLSLKHLLNFVKAIQETVKRF